MDKLIINGGNRLCGNALVHGAKNSALPILAASLTVNGESIIHNCPDLSDVRATVKILKCLGCKCSWQGDTLIVNAEDVNCSEIPENLMREMRSSIIFLGALSSRCGKARLSTPGGCEIGQRPIDLHISSLSRLGLVINEEHGCIDCYTESGLHGGDIYLSIPSVGATENIMIAACTANGTTRILNAAREPEICDLADYLNSAGADISGVGTSDIVINGVKSLHGCEHTVIPDRILTATYMSAVAVAGGNLVVSNIKRDHLTAVTSVYRDIGCDIKMFKNEMYIRAERKIKRIKNLRTQYYPGFPTDAGPILISALSLADGTSTLVENIFENRFKFADEINRLGADVKIEGRTAIVEGVKSLSGAKVNCTDLRGGAALLVAGLAAEGTTELESVYHIDRGYEAVELMFSSIGADIRRE